jgi:myosin heavy subunit
MKIILNPRDLNGYITQALMPVVLAFALQFLFDFTTEQTAYLLVAFVVLFAAFLFARVFIMEGRAYYVPLMEQTAQEYREEMAERDAAITALQDELHASREAYQYLREKAQGFVTYTENLKKQNAEGHASMVANYEAMKGEVERLHKIVKQHESGEVLNAVRHDAQVQQAKDKQTIESLTKQCAQLKEALAKAKDLVSETEQGYAQRLREVRSEAGALKEQLSAAQKEIARLLPIAQAEEIRKLKQSFKTSLNNSSDVSAIKKAYEVLISLGETEETLKLNEQQLARLREIGITLNTPELV